MVLFEISFENIDSNEIVIVKNVINSMVYIFPPGSKHSLLSIQYDIIVIRLLSTF